MAKALDADTADALDQLGRRGKRCVEMLRAAQRQLEQGGVRAGEIVCYCCREAFSSLLALAKETPSITAAAREVVQVAGATTDADPSQPLGIAIRELEVAILANQKRTESRLQAVIRERAGREPLRFQADLYTYASRVFRRLGTSLHSDIELDSAEVLYEQALEIIAKLFSPLSTRLEEVERLLSKEAPEQGDRELLLELSADPGVLNYFFGKLARTGWFEALREHELLRPRETGGWWPAKEYLARLASELPDEAARWLAERVRDPGTSETQAASYIELASKVGVAAAPVVLDALRKFPNSEGVADETALFLDDLAPEDRASPDAMALLKEALKGITPDG